MAKTQTVELMFWINVHRELSPCRHCSLALLHDVMVARHHRRNLATCQRFDTAHYSFIRVEQYHILCSFFPRNWQLIVLSLRLWFILNGWFWYSRKGVNTDINQFCTGARVGRNESFRIFESIEPIAPQNDSLFRSCRNVTRCCRLLDTTV